MILTFSNMWVRYFRNAVFSIILVLLTCPPLSAQMQDSLVSFFPHQLSDSAIVQLEELSGLQAEIVLKLGQNRVLEQVCPAKQLEAELQANEVDLNFWLRRSADLLRFGQIDCHLRLLQQLRTYTEAFSKPERVLVESQLALSWSEYLGDYEKAARYAEAALALLPTTENGTAWAYYAAGRVNHRLANFAEAYEQTQEALSLARLQQDRELEARSLGSLALINRDVFFGESLKAVPFHKSAIEIAESIRDTSVLLNELIYLAANYGEANQPKRYLELIQRTLALMDSYQEIRIEEKILINYGAFLSSHGAYSKAEVLFSLALDLARTINKRSTIGHLHYQLFEVQLMQGNTEAAQEILANGLQEGLLDSALLQEQMYALQRMRGDRVKALQHLEQAYQAVKGQYMDRNAAMLSFWDAQLEKQESLLEIERQRERLTSEEQRSQLYTYLLLAVGLLSVVALYALYYQRKTSRKLVAQNRQIELQAQELRQLDDLKSRFFTNVSHELRTPLSLILGPIRSILNRDTLTEEDNQLLSMAAKNGEQLNQLVNEILDFSKLESRQLEVKEAPINLYLFLDQLIGHFDFLKMSKEIDFKFNFQADQEMRVELDKHKMEKVIINLLSNAFKFTDVGGQISLQVIEEDTTLHFEVADSGQGIASEDLPHVFERYYQSIHGPSNKGGTGIGLALSYQYIKLFQGEMWVESEWGKGSSFQFRIPKKLHQLQADASVDAEVSTGPAIEDKKEKGLSQSDQAHILVVEDNEDLRSYLSIILGSGYIITMAAHGGEALAYMARSANLPDLIISDLMMPVVDGFQLLNQLRNNPEYRQIPVIMLTAKVNIEDRLTALRIGIDDYLVKPFVEEELLARVQNVLRFYRAKTPPATTAKTGGEKRKSISGSMSKAKHDLDWLLELEQTVAEQLGAFNLTADMVAKKMLMSRTQLFRKVKKLTGLTVNQYIQEMRFQEARKLLENQTHSSVKAVALSVGFKQVKHFSQRFKDRFGRLPSSYF